jgi:hypothetical protein
VLVLEVRVKVEHGSARLLAGRGTDIGAEAARRDQQRRLGWVSERRCRVGTVDGRGRAAGHRDRQRVEDRIVTIDAFAGWRFQVQVADRCPHRDDVHAVRGQRSRLVGTDHGG